MQKVTEREILGRGTLASPRSDVGRFKTLSLFSGIGGFEVGMQNLGFQFRSQLEIDAACVVTLNRNFGRAAKNPIIPTDIMKVKPEDFYDGEVDYIVGGPPCQSFSAAGRRTGGAAGTDDVRGTLFGFYCQYLRHFRPKAFVFENVRGILSSKGGRDWEIIRSSFLDAGYRLFWRVLNSADYGVPQFRERLFMVGIRRDIDCEFLFPRPMHGPDSRLKSPYVTAWQALHDLDNPSEIVPPYGGKYGHLIPEIPEGENYRFFTEEMGHERPQFAWRSKFSGFLYKMARDEPCRTVVSGQGKYDGPFHWRNRKCTIPEFRRLQGFPDDFWLPQSHVEAVKQLGNSVTPPVAAALGQAIVSQLESSQFRGVELLDSSEVLTFDKRKGAKARRSRARKSTSVVAETQQSLLNLIDTGSQDEEEKFRLITSPIKVGGFGMRTFQSGSRFRIHASEQKCDYRNKELELDLTFVGGVTRQVRRVQVVVSYGGSTSISLQVAWSIAHSVIRRYTTFDSLQPLWGHFTEPYPKFTVNYSSTETDLASSIQRLMIQKSLDRNEIPMSELKIGRFAPEQVISECKEIGFDVRTHVTHPAVSSNAVRICYPFATPREVA